MKAVILAAGEGSRMRPLTLSRPKVMLTVASKPILEHLLLNAVKATVRDFIFVVGYHDEQIRNYFGNGSRWKVNIDYVTQRKQLGTADALRMVGAVDGENFLVLNGDVIINHEAILSLMGRQATTMTLVEVSDARGLGVVTASGDRVKRVYEKAARPPSNLANAGLYLFTPEIFSAVLRTQKSHRGEYELTDSIQILIDSGLPVNYQIIDKWLDMSYPWDLLTASEALLSNLEPERLGEIEERVTIKEPVSIGRGTVVKSGAYIIGPVIIGENCEIGPNCYIRPATSIGNDCHIGAGCEVKNSIIMNGSKMPHLSYIGDSIVGENCNFGAGTKVANLRLDEKDISVGGVNTRRRKLGAIVGDGVQTGINASINAGSVIGNSTFIGPGATISGVIAPDSRIF